MTAPVIEFREVTRSFVGVGGIGRRTVALDRFSLAIEAGEVVALVGRNVGDFLGFDDPEAVLLDADQEDVPSFITFDDIRMVVVRRSKGVGIRVWDNQREQRRTFPSRQWYLVKPEFRVPAVYTRYEIPKVVKMPDILGAVLDEPMQGFVTFELNGQKHELIVEELPDRRLFVQFMDKTNGNPTYPSGRYHYADAHVNGRTFLDFNKAYSPPCAFTDYATCTFPPQENHLSVAIEAGEIYPGHH